MSDKTGIAWTDATWNPVTGCSKVSDGCRFCYAETISKRFGRSFEVTLHPERLDEPLHWRKPRRVFVCSMSDLFHEAVPDDFIHSVFQIMDRTGWDPERDEPRHTYQVLTKRPERMAPFMRYLYTCEYCGGDRAAEGCTCGRNYGPLPNVWLGVSIENARYAWRADILRQTPAAVRFVSAEPLLGPLPSSVLDGIDWLIVGGESGPRHRPMDLVAAMGLIHVARFRGIPVFVKQGSGPRPGMQGDLPDWAFALREYPR
jgi:protein gp37